MDSRDGVALRALAVEAGEVGERAIRAVVGADDLEVWSKSRPGDLVTAADVASERAIIEFLLERRPGDGVLAEESGITAGTSGVRWVIDPIDGTVNFVHGRRDWAIAIAAEVDDRLACGMIRRPAYGDWFAAGAGSDPAGSDGPPSVSKDRKLGDALISVAIPAWGGRRERMLAVLGRLLPHVRDFRRTASASVDLSDLASGRLDAIVGLRPKPWDLLPGLAIALAAGAHEAPVAAPVGELLVVGAPAVVEDLVPLVDRYARLAG